MKLNIYSTEPADVEEGKTVGDNFEMLDMGSVGDQEITPSGGNVTLYLSFRIISYECLIL
jgi:hypothetical protein